MEISKFSKVALSLALTAILVGCGGGGSDSSTPTDGTAGGTTGGTGGTTSPTVKTQTGVLIDDVVVGANYKTSGFENGVTNSKGEFSYKSGKIEFFLGKLKVGEMSSMPSDKKAFLSDILGLQRGDYKNTKLVKLARLMQSLDSIKGDDKITLDNSQVKTLFSSNQKLDDVNISKLGIDLVSAEDAMKEVKQSYKDEGVTPTETNTSTGTSTGGSTGTSTGGGSHVVVKTLNASLTNPIAGAKIPSGSTGLKVTFTSAVKDGNITVSSTAKEEDNAKLKCGDSLVNLTKTYADKVLTLTADLPEKKDCKLTLANIKGVNGASIVSQGFDFSTGDSEYPTVSSAKAYETNTDKELLLSISTTKIVLVFGENMADVTASDIEFINTDGNTPVTFNVAKENATTWNVNPTNASNDFNAENKHFKLTIKKSAKDKSGLTLQEDKVYSFHTADTVAPTFTSIVNSKGVAVAATGSTQDINETFVLTFSEPIKASTLTAGVTVKTGGSPFADAEVKLDSNDPTKVNITLKADKFYADNTDYVIAYTTDLKDESDNAIGTGGTYKFTAVDKFAPKVTSKTPDANATDVAATDKIVVKFDEAVDISGCSAVSDCVTVQKDGSPVTLKSGSELALTNSNKTLTITLDEAFAQDGAGYLVTLKGGIKDKANTSNPLAETSFSFTAKNDAPTVSGTPEAKISDKTITITFSESIKVTDDLNVTIAQNSVIDPKQAVSTNIADKVLTLTNDGNDATDFDKSAKIVIHIENGSITDLLGEAYAGTDIEVATANIKD